MTAEVCQISDVGLVAHKCPSTLGDKWVDGVDLPICKENSIKTSIINVILDEVGVQELSLFWIFLILREALQCDINFVHKSEKVKKTVGFQNNLFLKKYNNITLVSTLLFLKRDTKRDRI